MEVLQVMEHHYWGIAVLRLCKPIYELKQATLLFWQRLLEMMKNMGHEQSVADPRMYFSKNKACELAIWLNWMDDNLIEGPPQVVKDEGKKLVK